MGGKIVYPRINKKNHEGIVHRMATGVYPGIANVPSGRKPFLFLYLGLVSQASAPVNAHGQRGESPLQACTLRPVTESNCVVVRRGGKQLEVNDQSTAKANQIRLGYLGSLLASGEPWTCRRWETR